MGTLLRVMCIFMFLKPRGAGRRGKGVRASIPDDCEVPADGRWGSSAQVMRTPSQRGSTSPISPRARGDGGQPTTEPVQLGFCHQPPFTDMVTWEGKQRRGRDVAGRAGERQTEKRLLLSSGHRLPLTSAHWGAVSPRGRRHRLGASFTGRFALLIGGSSLHLGLPGGSKG